eukprot:848684-Prorocentrum_minimum.AAC.3
MCHPQQQLRSFWSSRLKAELHMCHPQQQLRVQKKKVFEGVQPDLNTSDARVVRYKDLEMLTSTGAVTVATLTGASVS